MSETVKLAVRQALLRILEPLVRLLLQAGIGAGEFHQLVKESYVRAARDMNPGARPNYSRIAVITGITRLEVTKILKSAETRPATINESRDLGASRAERVLRGWWRDREFQNNVGRPDILPLRGHRRSFATLVERYAGGPRALTVLRELLRVKAVRRLPDRNVEALSPTVATVHWEDAGVRVTGEHVRDLLTTLTHNLEHPSRPHYVRFVVQSRLDPRYEPLLVRDLTLQAENLAESFQDSITDADRIIRPGQESQAARRLGVGIFVIDEPVTVDPLPALRKVRPRRRR